MLSQLALLSLASASVEYNFRIEHGPLSPRNEHHSVHKRSLSSNSTGNSSVQPIVNATLTPSYNFYVGPVNFGSPEQEIDVLIDTGSPVSWVYGPEGSYHNASMYFGNQSSTYEKGNRTFSASYGSGQYLGHWVSDLVSAPQFVNSGVIKNATTSQKNTSVPFEFGVISSFATSAGIPGLLGLGPHIDNAGPSSYNTLPEAYAKQNITSSPAFSLFLEEEQGRFLFGSVDTKYFEYPLRRFKPSSSMGGSVSGGGGSPSSWQIFLDGVYLDNGTEYTVRSNVVLDSGSPVSLLPPGFVDSVGKTLGLTKYGKYETYYLNSTTNSTLPSGTFSFDFNGFEIEADVSDFLVPGEYVWLDDGPKNVTALALMGSHNYLLGDGFFRNTYSVFDPSTKEVMLAQRTKATLNSSNSTNGSTIIPISSIANNSTAIINGTNSTNAATTSSRKFHPVATSTESGDNGVTTTVVIVAANQYLGSVSADKAASMAATGDSSDAAASASATSSSETSSSSTVTSSTSASNAGFIIKPGAKLWFSLFAFILAFII